VQQVMCSTPLFLLRYSLFIFPPFSFSLSNARILLSLSDYGFFPFLSLSLSLSSRSYFSPAITSSRYSLVFVPLFFLIFCSNFRMMTWLGFEGFKRFGASVKLAGCSCREPLDLSALGTGVRVR